MVTFHKDDDTPLLATNQPRFATANNPSAAGSLAHPGYSRNVAHSADMTALQVPRATSTSAILLELYSTHKKMPRHTRTTQGGTRVFTHWGYNLLTCTPVGARSQEITALGLPNSKVAKSAATQLPHGLQYYPLKSVPKRLPFSHRPQTPRPLWALSHLYRLRHLSTATLRPWFLL